MADEIYDWDRDLREHSRRERFGQRHGQGQQGPYRSVTSHGYGGDLGHGEGSHYGEGMQRGPGGYGDRRLYQEAYSQVYGTPRPGTDKDLKGPFTGRGPRSYQRSDKRIKEDVADRMTDNEWLDATDIEIEVTNSEVTLTGTVEDRDMRRLAEDIAEGVAGVRNVLNQIRVRS